MQHPRHVLLAKPFLARSYVHLHGEDESEGNV